MRFKIRFGSADLLLTAEQLDAMIAIAEQVQVWDERYVGTNKGYIGHENNYELEFPMFDVKRLDVGIISTHSMNKWETLIEYRKQAKENDNA